MDAASKARAAAETIWSLVGDGKSIAELPADLRPTNRAEGYAAQERLMAFSAQPLFGWKIAATSKAGQEHIQVDGPLAGRLLAERAFGSGAAVSLFGNRMQVAEGEFAFRMARDLAPRGSAYSIDEVVDAVASLHPAIEVPNSRFQPFEKAGAAQLIADNACADYFLLGDAAPDSWRGIDLAAYRVTARDGRGASHEGVGSNVLGSPTIALAWLVNELSSQGFTLKAGQVVTTGTCFKPFAIAPGEAVVVDFGALGRIAARFTD
ncbi:MAG: 2-keto-4-pentenoate hydratase [Burkholderiales bacterium]